MDLKKKEDQLFNEKFDVEWEIINKIETLIDASWDSNTLKQQIETLVKQLDNLWGEIHKLGTCCPASKSDS